MSINGPQIHGVLNTRHLNAKQVKVHYSDVSVIQIPTDSQIQSTIQITEQSEYQTFPFPVFIV